MSTAAPIVQRVGSVGPVRSITRSDTRVVCSVVLGAYVTGGIVLTLPDELRGMDLLAINVMNAVTEVGVDRIYGWNGSVSAPKIIAKVISTAAELANASATSTAPLFLELIYGQ